MCQFCDISTYDVTELTQISLATYFNTVMLSVFC